MIAIVMALICIPFLVVPTYIYEYNGVFLR